jgi:hypothetical protein
MLTTKLYENFKHLGLVQRNHLISIPLNVENCVPHKTVLGRLRNVALFCIFFIFRNVQT